MAEDPLRESSLEITPTWAVATVVFVLLSISILLEHLLSLVFKHFSKKRRKAVIQALDNIKSELMLLGFISLFLTVGETQIAKICIPRSLGDTFLPCSNTTISSDVDEESPCADQGKISLLSTKAMQELQYLIFVLALFHSLSSVITFSLGMSKMRTWESWEEETRSMDYQFRNDPRRFRLIHQTSFAKRHLSYFSAHRFFRLLVSFFRQLYQSVSKVDYFTLRHGFIKAHFAERDDYNFQKYIKRTLEKDFGVVVRIKLWIWMFSVVYIFFHAYGTTNNLVVSQLLVASLHSLGGMIFLLSSSPFQMLLLVGTKLQAIITRMCLERQDQSLVVRGTLLVRPSDDFFWFKQPKLLLHLMHFILFQNSFQLAFFTWSWFKFGFRSCFHHETEDIVIRMVMGVLVQLLCGYVTLPLYALVTQMGTTMNKAVFTEGVVEGLKHWRAKAKKNLANRSTDGLTRPTLDASQDGSIFTSPSPSPSPSFSVDASCSFKLEGEIPNNEFVVVDMSDMDDENQVDEKLNLGSFHGFDVSKITNDES